METGTPACARSLDRDERAWTVRRTAIAVAASGLVHAALLAAVTLTASLTKPPPALQVEEAIAVEVVDAASIGLRMPQRLDSMPIAPAQPQAPDAAIAPAKPAEDAVAAAAPPVETSLPTAAEAAAAAPASDVARPNAAVAESVPPAAVAAAPSLPSAPVVALDAAPPPAETSAILAAPPAGFEMAARADVADLSVASAPAQRTGPDAVAPPASEPPPALVAELPSQAVAAPPSGAPLPIPSAAPAVSSSGPPPAEPATAPSALPAAASAPAAPPPTDLAALAPARPPDAPVEPAAVAAPPPTPLRPVDPRESVAAALKGLDCSHISATVDVLGGTVSLAGHARSEADRQRIAREIASLAGIRRVDDTGLRIVGEPYCRVLGFLDRPEFQRSSEQRYDISTVGATNQPGLKRAVGGEALPLTLSAPEFDAYLYVDHFSADGRVTHLLPTDRPDNFLKADAVFRLGPGEKGRRAVISPPYGLDVITVLAASEALFVRPRPLSEEAATYIAALDDRLKSLTASGLRLRYEYAYYLLATEPPPRPSH